MTAREHQATHSYEPAILKAGALKEEDEEDDEDAFLEVGCSLDAVVEANPSGGTIVLALACSQARPPPPPPP